MLLYFTGSGNSRYVADALAQRLSDEAVSLNSVLKTGSPKNFTSRKPYVVVAPIYAWRLPRVVEGLLRQCVFDGNSLLYFVVTMGAQSGACDRCCEKLCRETGMRYMGLRGVVMPDNYVLSSTMPDRAEIDRILAEAEPVIDQIAASIRGQIPLVKTDKTVMDRLLTGVINPLFYRFVVTDKAFAASDACISCGLCQQLCPVNNIRMENGRPVFQGRCMHCYACIHRCPKAAIDIRGKTETHGRYVCPPYPRK